jgi:hypothetical protein
VQAARKTTPEQRERHLEERRLLATIRTGSEEEALIAGDQLLEMGAKPLPPPRRRSLRANETTARDLQICVSDSFTKGARAR